MNFKKISLNSSGIKGAEIHFLEPNERGVMELTKKYPKHPVHIGLEKLFKDLRVHLLQVCKMIHDDMDVNIQAQLVLETSVHTIETDGQHFVIHGEMLATDEKYISLKTYKLEEADGYVQYDMVKELVDKICEETTEYLAGTKKVDDSEIILRWSQANHKEDEITEETLKKYTPEQQREIAVKIIEKGYGGIVMFPEDMTTDEEHMAGVVEELKTEFEVAGGETVIELQVAEKKTKGKGKGKKEAAHELAAVTEPVGNSPEEEF